MNVCMYWKVYVIICNNMLIVGVSRIEDLVVGERESTRQKKPCGAKALRDLTVSETFSFFNPLLTFVHLQHLLPIKHFLHIIHPIVLLIDHVRSSLTQVHSYDTHYKQVLSSPPWCMSSPHT